MKLQIALDFDFDFQKSCTLLKAVEEDIDIIEAGTPFLMEEGLQLLTKLKEAFPDKCLLADLKIADAGYREAENAFKAGADIVTVLGAMDDATVENVIKAAKDNKKQVLVDMIGCANLPERLRQIDDMQPTYLCLHTSKDLQKLNPDVSKAFLLLREIIHNSKLAIAGGIGPDTIAQYAAIKPDVVVVGEAITQAANPKEQTAVLRKLMDDE